MKLHLDSAAFRVLIESIHQKTGYREDVLEKDYYVTLVLKELADKQQMQGLPAYFKGGTALYKALKTTNRFSEDIDLSVDTRGCSRTQSDKRLEQATKKYVSLSRDSQAGRTNRSEIISVYEYAPIAVYDAEDALQRFGKLKVEATSFTISEPVESLEIAPMLYDLASDDQKRILEQQYDVAPFKIKTITLERAFVDKLFAAEAYTRKSADAHRAFEAAKHLYDLAVMAKLPRIQRLFRSAEQLKHLLDIRMEEESNRLDGIPGVKPQEFNFFTDIASNTDVRKAYDVMQRQYVLRAADRIPFEDAVAAMQHIRQRLQECPAWTEYRTPMKIQMTIAQRNADRHNAERSAAPVRKKDSPSL